MTRTSVRKEVKSAKSDNLVVYTLCRTCHAARVHSDVWEEVHLQEVLGGVLCRVVGYPGGYIAWSRSLGRVSSPRYDSPVGAWEECHRLVMPSFFLPAPAVCADVLPFGLP